MYDSLDLHHNVRVVSNDILQQKYVTLRTITIRNAAHRDGRQL